MKTFYYKLMLGIVILIAVVWVVKTQRADPDLGSVAVSNGYLSTTTPTVGDGKLLCTGPSLLGSVVMSGPIVGGKMQILNATTTDVVNGNAVRAATSTLVIADFSATVLGNASSTGTYTYDAVARHGLIVASQGNTLSTSTITYRCNE